MGCISQNRLPKPIDTVQQTHYTVIKHIPEIAWQIAFPASHHNQEIETGGDVLLLNNTVNTRTYVRLLRHLGIALVFAPEPFTTPFGVACILAARHLSKRHEASINNHLRETIQYYLAHTGHFCDHVDGAPCGTGPSKGPRLGEERPILGQITGSRSFEARLSVRKGSQSMRESRASRTSDMRSPSPRYKYGDGLSDASTGSQKVIHHTIDTEWLSRRYESASIAVAHSGWATISGNMEGITHHLIDIGLLSQRYGTGNVGQAKAKSHTINIAQLRQRYGSAASYTTVHRALRNYSRHCDMSSRKNVIEGY